MSTVPDPIDAWQNAPLARDLPTVPPVTAGSYRGILPRTLRERFIDTCTADGGSTDAAEQAWQLMLDAWRVIEVADARAGNREIAPDRLTWLAALNVAIFRAEHPEAPELSTEPADPERCEGCGQVGCSASAH